MTSPQRPRLRIIFREGVLDNNYPDPDTLTHGWRWYLIENDRLVSPMHGQIPLPRNGVLDDVYFIPKASRMLAALDGCWRDLTPEMIRERGFALTYGRVYPPFARDLNISQVFGSMKCARYEALAICTTTPEKFVGAYELPIIGDINLRVMEDVERRWGTHGQAPATP